MTLVLPAGSALTVHYNDGRDANRTTNDFPVFVEPHRVSVSAFDGSQSVITGFRGAVDCYICNTADIIDKKNFVPRFDNALTNQSKR